MSEYNGGSLKAQHLCVLVHGLWGEPKHLASVAKGLRAQYDEDKLHILIAKSNKGYYTYDGIETGGERVCLEIEDELAAIKARGGNITKLSIVGYSMGGLVARYAIGLLYAKGVLDKLECMNFTAFASPFIGTRSPTRHWLNRSFNLLGARLVSKSGRQMFLVDTFRDTKRPLLAVLADKDSIFMAGLAKFKRRSLYANITNDRSAVYYTTAISKTDPFDDLEKLQVHYQKGYENVILDDEDPFTTIPAESIEKKTLQASASAWFKRLPITLALSVFLPVVLTAFVVTSSFQTVQSSKRIKLHEDGRAGIDTGKYRVPLWMKKVRGAVDGAYETLNSAQAEEFLGSDSDSDLDVETREVMARERKMSRSGPRETPTLALSPEQFTMVNNLDSLGWRKHRVHIQKASHSHAAIIVRWETERFDDGKVVIRHWLNEEFLA